MEWLTQIDWCGLTGFGVCVVVPCVLFVSCAASDAVAAWARRQNDE